MKQRKKVLLPLSCCQWQTHQSVNTNRVIFNWVSKVIRDCIGFALLCSVSGLENSRHLLSHIRYKTKTNRDLVTRVFPRLRPVTCVYFDFSLAPSDIFVCSNWPLWFLWFWFYDTQSKSALRWGELLVYMLWIITARMKLITCIIKIWRNWIEQDQPFIYPKFPDQSFENS